LQAKTVADRAIPPRLRAALDGLVPSVRRARFDGWFVSALAASLAPAEFVAVDTETNGYGGDLCEMTEVGAVLVGGGELHETYDSLVQVERPLSRGRCLASWRTCCRGA
jgi:DNA polymerase III epsilon subunit-like protein